MISLIKSTCLLYTGQDDNRLQKHHITIIPKYGFAGNYTMNETNTTEGGYANSKMVQEILPKSKRCNSKKY